MSGLRTSATLLVLVLMLALGAFWGWHQVIKPFPARAKASSICTETAVHAGDRLSAAGVVVSVLNASNRLGLADRTLTSLTQHHFAAGDSGNAPASSGVRTVQIWTDDPTSPAVKLVASWLPGVAIVNKPSNADGVVVVVGPRFSKVKGGRTSITVTKDANVCGPLIS